jgi:hypothetical protein
MKTIITFLLLISFIIHSGFNPFDKYNQGNSKIDDASFLDPNSIKVYLQNDGLLHRNGFNPGFEVPKGSGKHMIYASGLWLGAKINDSIRIAHAQYGTEFRPGYFDFNTQSPHGREDSLYRIYKVSPDHPDGNEEFDSWFDWPIEQGAQWIDVNGNGQYEPPVDKPLMKGEQNIFCKFTDGYEDAHNLPPGRTKPMRAEVLMYAYSKNFFQGATFVEYRIVNKNISAWDSTSVAFWSDVDIGHSVDDLVGCDTNLNLGFGYNGNNNDPVYGLAPPAIGYLITKATGHSERKMDFFHRIRCGHGDCPMDSLQAFHFLQGRQLNGSPIINPVNNFPTKYQVPGDPVADIGWIDFNPGERYLALGSFMGAVEPLDTIEFNLGFFVAQGASNLNSLSVLKQHINLYNAVNIQTISNELPENFHLSQNYPNPFNPTTNIRFQIPESGFVTLKIFDITGREVATLVNEQLNAGEYNYQFSTDEYRLSSGAYFYRLIANDKSRKMNFSQSKKMVVVR